MTKQEMDELGTMAMKVINNVELTEEEELRFAELSKKLEEFDTSTMGPVLAGSSDGDSGPVSDRDDVRQEPLEAQV